MLEPQYCQHGDDECVFCEQESETITHLLVGCSYSREVWFLLLSQLNLGDLTPLGSEESLASWWEVSRKRVQNESRKTLDSLAVLTAWSLWLQRNARTFNRQVTGAAQLMEKIKQEALLWVQAKYLALQPLVSQYNSSFPFGRESNLV